MFFIIVKIFLLSLVISIQSTQGKSSASANDSCVVEKGLTMKTVKKMLKELKISDNSTSIKEARNFTEKINEIDILLGNEVRVASFEHATNLTDCKKNILDEKSTKHNDFIKEAKEMAEMFKWKSFKKKNGTLYRWFKLFLRKSDFDIWKSTYELAEGTNENKSKSMREIYQDARVCPYEAKKEDKSKCNLAFYPDLLSIMAKSRNPKELQFMWTQYRNETGVKMREGFLKAVKMWNEFAKADGFKEYGQEYRLDYETKHFAKDMEKLMNEILPLYKQLHAFVRKTLRIYYKDVKIKKNGPIPAHLLGNMYAQQWQGIFDIVNPYKDKKLPNVTEFLIKKKMKAIDMFMIAENFFVSMGLKRMTPYFWKHSMIEKPEDREVVCHASAHDMADGKDFRIKQCTTIDEDSLETIHHEMGHTEYQMLYSNQPVIFRDGACDGFHEAVGEVITLSASTPEYLHKTLFKNKKKYKVDKKEDIMHLLRIGLQYIPNAPYTFIIDTYRYKIFNGTVTEEDLNLSWWSERLKFQGVCPPVKRSEEHFDAGAKYHVANNVEYMRYFFANIFTFQLHKSLCDEIHYKGPLHKCNLYNQKRAGALLKKVLSLGKSKNWMAVMKVLTKGKSSTLKSGPFLEYFKPLMKWLKKENAGEKKGWESEDPMQCP